MQKRASVLLQEAKENAAAILHTAEEREYKKNSSWPEYSKFWINQNQLHETDMISILN